MAMLNGAEAQAAEGFLASIQGPNRFEREAVRKRIEDWIDADPDHALDVLERIDPDAIDVPEDIHHQFVLRARHQVYADYPFPGRP